MFLKITKEYEMTETTQDALLTVHEAAEYLRVPVSWVYERTRTRAIPVRKLGHHVRIPRSELVAWVEEEGTAQAG
jgi:excisionase family DNA binding protein